jgi:hypothetical protein
LQQALQQEASSGSLVTPLLVAGLLTQLLNSSFDQDLCCMTRYDCTTQQEPGKGGAKLWWQVAGKAVLHALESAQIGVTVLPG